MARSKLQWWVVKAIQTAVILGLALLATATPGSPSKEGGGGGPPFAGGISGNWEDDAEFHESYRYAIVPASLGNTFFEPESACTYSSAINPDFLDGVDAALSADLEVHAFWFLVSYEYAQTYCEWTMSAFQWGRQQGAMFDQLLASTGLHHDVGQLLGDVEFIGSSPSSCPGHAIPDTARWECGSNPANREVVKGFLDKMAEVKGSGEYYTGVYTNTEWDEIVGSGVGPRPDLDPSHPWVLPTYYLWLASWDPTPALLEEQTGDVSNLGFYMFSWQYATDLCQMPVGGDMGAEALATDNGIYIPGWDRWTGGITSSTC